MLFGEWNLDDAKAVWTEEAKSEEREKWQTVVSDKDKVIADNAKVLADKDSLIADNAKVLADKDAEIAALRAQLGIE